MHKTQELWQAALRDPVLALFMQDVFPSCPSSTGTNKGTNWVAVYFASPEESEFFDSYGFPPEMYGIEDYELRDINLYNDVPLQGLASDVCGDYCLFHLLHRKRNMDLKTIQAKLRIKDSQWNDT